ncbi:MAG: efflux RND transporter permease subunit [Candidatus Zixiibacteriota bacterium]|nr:MAG: efflux RND transporter permease subunit [candidate division Zixibacteria bacterium]
MKISEISINRPVFATMMIAALLVLGWFSYTDMSVELFPEVDFPFVVVTTVYPGASAEAVEKDVTKNLEDVVNEISGVRHIISRSREGYSLIFAEFQLEVDGSVAAQDVREKVAGIRSILPDDIEEPVVSQFDPSAQAIMALTVDSRRPPRDLTKLVKDKIQTRLEAVTGVGSVELVGGQEREIQVQLNPDRLASYQLTVDDVHRAIAGANMEVPGGRVDEASREYLVRVQGRLRSVDDFGSVIVKNRQGTPIYLSDVASVKDTVAEQRSLSRFNGKSAVSLRIIKQSGANVVDLAREVREVLARLDEELPADVNFTIVRDDAVFIEDSIHEILFNIQFGTTLAVLVIFLFLLDIRPTIITGLSIPISIIATFTLMKFLGFTVNFMTLLGLSLAVGILIDDSIVVVENVYRKMQEGLSPFKAAFAGTKEIGLAVSATTFSIMVVFLPVAFMEGIVGRFFYQFGMTVAFAVLISLFVAFTLVPMLSARTSPPAEDPESLDPARARGWRRLWLRTRRPLSIWNRAFDAIRPGYRSLLAWSLNHRLVVILTAGITFIAALAMVTVLGTEFFEEADQGQISVIIETPPGTTLQETSDRIARVESVVRQISDVTGTYVTIGAGNTEVTNGNLLIILNDASERDVTVFELIDSLRVMIAAVPGIKYSLTTGEHEGGSDKPVELSIRGDDRDELIRLSREVQEIMLQTPGTTDVDNTLEEGKPEFQIEIDRKLADDLGIDLATLSRTIRTLVEGDVVTRYKEGDDEYDVRLRLDQRFRSSESDLGRILVESNKEVAGLKTFLVPLDRIAKITKGTSIGEYSRYDRQPEVRVNANVLADAFAGTVTTLAQETVDTTVQLPPGYMVAPVGTQEIMVESFTNIFRALILAVIFIYLLLASQYESFFDPFSIMLSLPLSLVGAILGLLVFNSSLSMMSLIGIVMLMGLVTKNAILLIDFVKQERRKGVDRTAAILRAGPIRLRPILMTTFATVFGMLPLALGIGPGAEFRAPMARAVIGGMLSSTLLTLVVVPVTYTVIDDVVAFVFRRSRKAEKVVKEEVAFDQ